MLAITQNAIDAVKQVTPGDSGLRLSLTDASDDGTDRSLQLEIVETPAPEDQVLAAQGAKVFLEPAAAEMLDDMVLDAAEVGDRVKFGVAPRG